MTKIDLITGFLGSGKTTFIRHYVKYLLSTGEKVCILENDYGAINIDTMLLSDLKSDFCDIEMVAGGCDYDCHRRRFKTKLITMAMLGFDRVIVEPSGVYDIDEFFDILNETPIDTMYTIANVTTVMNAETETTLSEEAAYLLASQAALSGCIVLSHISARKHGASSGIDISRLCQYLNTALTGIKCNRTLKPTDFIAVNWADLTASDFTKIVNSGYHTVSFEKAFSMDNNGFEALFFMHIHMEQKALVEKINALFKEPSLGNVVRVKGFLLTGQTDTGQEEWIEINATDKVINITPAVIGQEVLIVIGENLDRQRIDSFFEARFSSNRLQ